jgi:cystathionine beta-lyase/cystathionine gamma-synthase
MQPDFGPSTPLAPAFIPSSVYSLPDLDALEAVSTGEKAGFIYSRDNHPNAVQLETELTNLESAAGTVVCGNGMAAMAMLAITVLGEGGRAIVSDRLYGRSTQLFMQELPHFRVPTEAIDTSNLSKVEEALKPSGPAAAKLLVVETMSNPLLSIANLPKLITLCKEHQVSLLVDNTFATPALCRPIELGADFVLESLTKMMGGHSDITLGAVSVKDTSWLTRLRQVRSIWGFMGDPFPCWLALRGLPTLHLRVEAACQNAEKLAGLLKQQKNVSRVIHPSLSDHPDHELAKTLFGGSFGNMMCFELQGGREAVNRFFRQAEQLKFCPSLGDYATTCSHPASTSHRYLEPEERERQGITDGLIRLSVGIEAWEELEKAFRQGLAQ